MKIVEYFINFVQILCQFHFGWNDLKEPPGKKSFRMKCDGNQRECCTLHTETSIARGRKEKMSLLLGRDSFAFYNEQNSRRRRTSNAEMKRKYSTR